LIEGDERLGESDRGVVRDVDGFRVH
jgi:hypothetical protein